MTKSGRFTPKKDPKTWHEAMAQAIEDGTVVATEIQAMWCKRDRKLLDVKVFPDECENHIDTCTGQHRILFVFEPVL